MKKVNLSALYLLAVLFVLSLGSCKKSTDNSKPDNQYLISTQIKSQIIASQALAKFVKLSPGAEAMAPFIKSDVVVRKLTYKTTLKDQKLQASGLVCVPKTAGNYPVISFQNGTNTLHSMAPSEAVDDDLYSIIESIAALGFIVVIPDYIGFGASAQLPHPYLDAESTTQSILDLLRAAKEFGAEDSIGSKPTKDLFIFGYSQGGWATMELQKAIETNYSSEFNLKASSCGAGPYSISDLNNGLLALQQYPTPYFLAYVLNAYHAIGSVSNPLSDFFNEPYASKIPALFDGTHTDGTINTELTPDLNSLLTTEYRTQFNTSSKFAELRTAFQTNSIVAWKLATPTRLYHGTLDEVIPFSVSQTMLAKFQAIPSLPSNIIELKPIEGAGHQSGVYEFGMKTILWFLTIKNS